jgi:hypothetical protein
MGKDAGAKKPAGGKGESDALVDAARAALAANTATACALTGFPASPLLTAAVTFAAPAPDARAPVDAPPPAAPTPDVLAVRGALGAPNTRALCAALLARGAGLAPTPYFPAKVLALLDAACGDSGAAAVADVLTNGELAGVALESVSLVRCGVGAPGAAALGAALMLGANASLVALSLDCNALGDAGARALARGLLTNRSLKRLSLASCGLRAEGAFEVASVVNSTIGVLAAVDLSGNDIGLAGLQALSVAALYSKTLAELTLCNCGLSSRLSAGDAASAAAALHAALAAGAGAGAALAATAAAGADAGAEAAAAGDAAAAPAAAFDALGRALASADCALGSVDLDGNPLTQADADALLPHVAAAPAKLIKLIVPKTLSAATVRRGAARRRAARARVAHLIPLHPPQFVALYRNVVPKVKKAKAAAKK